MTSRPSTTRDEQHGLACLAKTFGAGTRVVRTNRIGGGLSSVTDAVDLMLPDGSLLPVVAKRFVTALTSPEYEWEGLRFASSLPVPTPTPYALVEPGECFDEPCLVMGRLDGRPDLSPERLRRTRQLATTLAAIHTTEYSAAPAALRRPHLTADWEPPGPFPNDDTFHAALDVVAGRLASVLEGRQAFLHSDFNPGNVLWSDGDITGIVDWSVCRVGCVAWDVAYCRAELALLTDLATAEAFRADYESLCGEVEQLAVFDVVCGLNAWGWCPQWASAFHVLGRTDVSADRMRQSAQGFIEAALPAV